ncbi:endonuclease MutS2 [Scatolibacter rhodanostii]|uniref:endonuclease MutS2 n=1 Tax=Scatolibacter rhodanostii TaxID=2014781 RepID=UPI000C087FF8|nr:endonuclease MutS2 [Scatolibacter rhodanostii]
MNKNEKTLELDKILQMLANETSTTDAAELALAVEPTHDINSVKDKLEETDAAYILSAKFGSPSFYGMVNVSNALRRAEAGGSLNMGELLRVASTMRALRSLSQWRQKSEGTKTKIDGYFQVIYTNKQTEDRIFTAILSEEEMSDNASVTLASIRRKIKNMSVSVRDKLDKLIRSQTHQKHLQDAIVTMRSGRFVVPVKAEYRAEVPGLVHDSSSSGATVFVEPMAVVEANNEIRVLQAKEQEEMDRILQELSTAVGADASEVIRSYEHALTLDLIFAKANLAYKMKAVMPKINNDGKVLIHEARHPLIDPHQVVPTNISLGNSFDTLIITGPNTGGKTVALKTIGLLTLMTMCGLMIPAGDHSEIAIFDNILVDIGDEQSIEQSLSTFSSHMTNIIKILAQANEKSLVLMDELGAGTDPIEGAALATSIIEELRRKSVRLACTTHYAELKAYALQTEGVENGCCEFDVATLRPTYRLLIGVPGKSNAFAISRRLGMPQIIVERASELVSDESHSFEKVIGQLEKSRKKLEKELFESRQQKREIQQKLEETNKFHTEAEQKAQKEIDKARQDAEQIVAMTRAKAEGLIHEMEELRRQKNKEISADQKARMRAGIKELDSVANPVRERKSDGDYVLPRKLKAGDNVLIFDIDKKAVVLEEPKGEVVLVQAGIIKTRVNLKNLRLLQNQANKPQKNVPKHRTVTKAVSEKATTELDLRGMNVEESLMEVDNILDHAALMGIALITIIHGKGTGVLRNAVQQHLKTCSIVKSFRLGTYGEGESGVTIVELK